MWSAKLNDNSWIQSVICCNMETELNINWRKHIVKEQHIKEIQNTVVTVTREKPLHMQPVNLILLLHLFVVAIYNLNVLLCPNDHHSFCWCTVHLTDDTDHPSLQDLFELYLCWVNICFILVWAVHCIYRYQLLLSPN
jgi:hypothetical protein